MTNEFNEKITHLNNAFQKLCDALFILKTHGYQTEDVKTCLWRVEKAIKELDKATLTELQKEAGDIEFNDIIKGYETDEQ